MSGTDYLQPWVSIKYGEHLSPYVASRRQAAAAASKGVQGGGSCVVVEHSIPH